MKLQPLVADEIQIGTDNLLEEEVGVSSSREVVESNTKNDKCTGTSDEITLHCTKCTNLKKRLHNCLKIVSELKEKISQKETCKLVTFFCIC